MTEYYDPRLSIIAIEQLNADEPRLMIGYKHNCEPLPEPQFGKSPLWAFYQRWCWFMALRERMMGWTYSYMHNRADVVDVADEPVIVEGK